MESIVRRRMCTFFAALLALMCVASLFYTAGAADTTSRYTISEEKVAEIIRDLNAQYVEEKRLAPIEEVEKALRPYINPNYEPPASRSRASGLTIAGTKKISEVFPDPALAKEVARILGKGTNIDAPISQATLDGVTYQLTINGTGIKNLSGVEYFRRTNYLKVTGGEFTELPANIDNMTGLQYFQVTNGTLRRLPESFSKLLYQLIAADTMYNEIDELPASLGTPDPPNLYNWDLKYNRLTTLGAFTKMTRIQAVDFTNNLLTEIPDDWVRNRRNLTFVYLSDNQIEHIPPAFGSRTIYDLHFGNNKIKTVPAELANLKFINYGSGRFNVLNLGGNEIQTLPPNITRIPNVVLFNFENNKLIELPADVIQTMKSTPAKIKIFGQKNELPDKTLADDTITVASVAPAILSQLNSVKGSVIDGTITVTNKADGSDKSVPLSTLFGAGYDAGNLFGESGNYRVEIHTPAGTSFYSDHYFAYDADWTRGYIETEVQFDKTDWTNQTVTATVTVTSNVVMQSGTVKGQPMTIDASMKKATISYPFTANDTANIAILRPSGRTMTDSIKVTWIDKDKPTVAGLPNVSTEDIHALTAADLASVTVNDPATAGANHNGKDKSDIKTGTQSLWLYKVENGNTAATPSRKIAWNQIGSQWGSIAPGRYYYDVVIEDHAGNLGKASDAYSGKLIGNTGAGGTVPSVTINASRPTIVLSADGTTGNNGWYKSPVIVTVDSDNASGLKIIDVTIQNSGTSVYQKVPNSATDKGTFTLNDGVHALTGSAEDEIQLTATLAPQTIKVDTTAPSAQATDGGNGMLNNIQIAGTEVVPSGLTLADTSDIDANGYQLTVTSLNGQTTRSYTGSVADIQAAITADTTLSTGVYTVSATANDQAGNTSLPDSAGGAQFMHERAGDTEIVVVAATYSPDGRDTLPGNRIYTNGSVVVDYVVTSKLPLHKVDYNSVQEANSQVTTPDGNSLYCYRGQKIFATNDVVNIQATTKGLTQPAPVTIDIHWIDKKQPIVTLPSTPAEISAMPELTTPGTDIVITDDTETSMSGKTVQSGVATEKTRYQLRGSSGVVTQECTTLKAAYDEAVANSAAFRGKVELIVTAWDNAGNRTVATSGLVHSLEVIVPPGNHVTDAPAGLDTSKEPPKMLFPGGEAMLTSMKKGGQAIITYMDARVFNRLVVCARGDSSFTPVAGVVSSTIIGNRIILTAQRAGNYDLYVVGADNSFRKLALKIQ